MMIVGLTVTVVILVICCYTTVCMVGVCIDVHNMCAIDTKLLEYSIIIPLRFLCLNWAFPQYCIVDIM